MDNEEQQTQEQEPVQDTPRPDEAEPRGNPEADDDAVEKAEDQLGRIPGN